jgi:hypothetical protein
MSASFPFAVAALLLFHRVAEPAMSPAARTRLLEWFAAAGEPRADESFGSYLARVGYLQHGVAYDETTALSIEDPPLDLSRFECVTFIESSLAAARCGFEGVPTESCFEREIAGFRYRGGAPGGYGARLHYFDDWIADNGSRRRLQNLTASLGGEPVHRAFFHISARVLPRVHLPETQRAELAKIIAASESRLSGKAHLVLSRERAPSVLRDLEDGDIVAFVRERPGLLVHHAGLVYRVRGRPRLLHASSYHGRVVLTSEDVTSYLLRRPERRGVLVARPLAP